jgi:hypothetical protein
MGAGGVAKKEKAWHDKAVSPLDLPGPGADAMTHSALEHRFCDTGSSSPTPCTVPKARHRQRWRSSCT